MSDTILTVRGLSVAFGGVQAVNNVSFDLREGQILGVIGPNGAGKTTTFDAISGFAPSTGTVRLHDVELSALSPDKRSRARLGRSFQDARLFPSLTVSEALAVSYERYTKGQDVVSSALRLPWVSRSEKKIRARVDGIIDLMGLGAFYDKFISELSTGSRRIVDLAATMIHDPLVLLLDEPSSGIAQREAEALGPVLLRMREQTGVSILLIEHDMPLITSVSDELLALELGAVLMQGSCQEVLDDPRVVASYLGTDVATVQRSGTLDVGAAKKPAEPVTSGGAKVRRPARTKPPEVEVPATSPAARAARRPPVARKASVARRAPVAAEAPARKAPVREAPAATKAPVAAEVPARKAPAVGKAPARKAPARKTEVPARKAPVREAPAATKAPVADEVPVESKVPAVGKAPARKAPARKTTVPAPAADASASKATARKATAPKATARKAPAARAAAPAEAPARRAVGEAPAAAAVARVIPLRPEPEPAARTRTRKTVRTSASEDVS